MLSKTATFLMLLTFHFSIISCNAQKGETADDPWKKSFTEKYPDAKDVDWRKDSHDNREAHFEMDDKKYRADFDKNGHWIETERSVDFDDLPEAVQDRIKEDYDKDDLNELEWVDNKKEGIFYDVEFKTKGKNKDVRMREDGSILK